MPSNLSAPLPIAFPTALGDTLRRTLHGWEWRDGVSASALRDMTLADLAPNFRCCRFGDSTYVEIPHDWQQPQSWPGTRVDDDAQRAILRLIREGAAKPAAIYAEGLAEVMDDHRLTKHGYHLPVAVWDSVMGEIVGVWWDKSDENAVLARAKSLGWTPGRLSCQ